MASSTNATAKSPFIWTCVYEGMVDEIGLCLAVARDGSKPSVSCLKIEPRSRFSPSKSNLLATLTFATAKSPFIWTCVYEGAVKRLDFVCSSKEWQ